MPMGDTYDALIKGVFEGSTAPIASLEGFKWGEVVKYTTEKLRTGQQTIFLWLVNKKTWNLLTPDNQKIIEQVNEEWIDQDREVWDKYDLSGGILPLSWAIRLFPLSKEEDERW